MKDMTIAIVICERELTRFIQGRICDINQGTETPRLAVAFIQKYGRGMADALSSVYGTAVAGESIIKITEGKLSLIDPDWSEHNKDRFCARPADLKLTHP